MHVRPFLISLKTLYRMYLNNTGRFVSLPAVLSHFRLFSFDSGCFASLLAVFTSTFVLKTLEEPLLYLH